MTDHHRWGTACATSVDADPVPSDAAPFSGRNVQSSLDDELRLLRHALALLADDPVGNLDLIVKAITTELRILSWRDKRHDGDGQLTLALQTAANRVLDQLGRDTSNSNEHGKTL